EFEAIRGLPGDLPEGETVLWQGAPHTVSLALDAFKLRWILVYFAGLIAWRSFEGVQQGQAAMVAVSNALAVFPLALLAVALIVGLAWVNSRSTVYTITNKRVVMRFGAALTKAINIPFTIIDSAAANVSNNGAGSVAIHLKAPNKIPLLLLWPHARPGSWRRPEPAFRCIKDAATCAPILAEALRLAHAQSHVGVIDMSEELPVHFGADALPA
ncbi:MAG: hypothetical protein RLZZ157_504, partial [Pseudomonadota bacterium]